MDADTRTPSALRDGALCSQHVGLTWSVRALLRGWALDEDELEQASRLVAQVADTAGRSGRGLMSLSLSPYGRSLRVSADDLDPEAPDLSLQVAEPTIGRARFVVARQGATEGVVWFSLTSLEVVASAR